MKKINLKTVIGKKSFSASITLLLTASALSPSFANAHGDSMHDHGDNPVLTKVMFDQLELRDHDGEQSTAIDVQAWIGKDLNKFWLKVDAEKYGGEIQDAEVQALYSRAVATYWDLQLGLRHDIKPEPTTNWGVIGFHGLAPYFFDVDAALFIGESGHTAARFSAEYDLLFTQRLILSPEIDMNFYGQNDNERNTGSGLSDMNAGLRLRYEIYRELAPYIGINWEKKFGSTADLAKAKGEDSSYTEWVLGLRAWF